MTQKSRKKSPDTPAEGHSDRPSPAMTKPHSPFALMRRFSDEMDRLFEGFGGFPPSRAWLSGRFEGDWSPHVDAFKKNNHFVVRADLPGMTKDEVEVEVSEDALVIQGVRKQSHEESEEGYYCSECSFGSFYRSIPLPDGADPEHAEARFQNGVLEVSIPTAEVTSNVRHLDIQEGAASPERSTEK